MVRGLLAPFERVDARRRLSTMRSAQSCPPEKATGPGARRKGPDLQVHVRDNNVDQALRVLKKKMLREGLFREMKLRAYYEKPSEKRVREKADAIRRARKIARKMAQNEP